MILREMLPKLTDNWVEIAEEVDLFTPGTPIVYGMLRAIQPEAVFDVGGSSSPILKAFQMNGFGSLYTCEEVELYSPWPQAFRWEDGPMPEIDVFVDLSGKPMDQAIQLWHKAWECADWMILEDATYGNRRFPGMAASSVGAFWEFAQGRRANSWTFGDIVIVQRVR